MARKYNLISELYDRTCKTVVANPQNWQNFLQSAWGIKKSEMENQQRKKNKSKNREMER